MPRRRASRTELERHLADLAETFGWRHHRTRCPGLTRDGYADGFPGDTLLLDERLVFVSILGSRGALTTPESRWIEELSQVRSVEVRTFGRDDLAGIAAVLRRPRENEAI